MAKSADKRDAVYATCPCSYHLLYNILLIFGNHEYHKAKGPNLSPLKNLHKKL